MKYQVFSEEPIHIMSFQHISEYSFKKTIQRGRKKKYTSYLSYIGNTTTVILIIWGLAEDIVANEEIYGFDNSY